MKRKLYSTLLLSMTSLVSSLYGCSGAEKSDTITYDVTADVSVPAGKTPSEATKKTLDKPQLPTDNADIDTSSEPYILGREHAVRLHSDISDRYSIPPDMSGSTTRWNRHGLLFRATSMIRLLNSQFWQLSPSISSRFWI